MMPVISTAIKYISHAQQLYNGYCSSRKIYDLVKQKEPLASSEKVGALINGLFLSAQIINAGGSLRPELVSDRFKLATSSSVGTLDVLRKVSDKINGNDSIGVLDIAATAGFRLGDTIGLIPQAFAKNDWISKNKENLSCISSQTSAISELLLNREVLYKTADSVRKTFVSFCSTAHVMVSQWFSSTQEPPVPLLAQGFDEEQSLAENIFNRDVQRIINWENLDEIPEAFAQTFLRCKLSGKPIRYILVPSFSIQDSTMIFNKADVEALIESGADTVPTGWPLDRVPLRREDFIEQSYLQETINNQLQNLAQELQNL